jgi:hypothetical protein
MDMAIVFVRAHRAHAEGISVNAPAMTAGAFHEHPKSRTFRPRSERAEGRATNSQIDGQPVEHHARGLTGFSAV